MSTSTTDEHPRAARHDGATRDLGALFDPRSVAIIGASDDPSKWGHMLARHLLAADHDRVVHLVNRRGGQILGRAALTSLGASGVQVDLVAICVPASGFLDAVDDSLAAGARAIIGITAGLSESSDTGREIEEEAVRRVQAAGAFLVGPNCLGVIDTTSDLYLSSEPFQPGSVAVLSQSGNLVIDVDDLLRRQGLGISRFVSLGNQSDVSLADLMHSCVHHPGTSAVAVYAEDVRDGRAFVAAARALAEAGKPVVLLAPGRSAGASRGAASHTGSLTSPARVVDAACAAGGVRRVETPDEMVDALMALTRPQRAHGTRAAILTDGGGHGAIASDALHARGLDVPSLSEGLGAALRHDLWDQSPVSNPVDLAGMGEQDPFSYSRGVTRLLASDEVDAVLWIGYFGGYSVHEGPLSSIERDVAHEVVATVAAQGKPLVMQSIFPDSPSVRILREGGIPVYRNIGAAAAALAALVVPEHPSYGDALELPTPDVPISDDGYVATRALLADAGVPFPAVSVVRSEAELLSRSGQVGPVFPWCSRRWGCCTSPTQEVWCWACAMRLLLSPPTATSCCVCPRPRSRWRRWLTSPRASR
jgi:acyl-CoA synthetase (NDP forming)